LTHSIKVPAGEDWDVLLEGITQNRAVQSPKQEEEGRAFPRNETWSSKARRFLDKTYTEN